MTTDDIPGCKYIFSKLLEPNAGSPLPDRTRYNMTGNTMTSMMTTTMEKMRSMTSINCVTQLKLYTVDKLSGPIFYCLSVCEALVTPDQISTFSNIYRHTSPLLTLYHLIPSRTNLY